MPIYFIRSTVFNLCFFVLTGISCIILLPTLLLPRPIFLGVVYGFVRITSLLEKYILGLTYEIRGRENLPKNGSYIVAAKHQSAYETLKLHILFNDPAVVLKQELLKIPLWGKYLKKSDVIAIDRSTPKAAIKSIQDGAKHVAAQGRPIIIFPQGTRVAPEITAKEKPYKIGIIRMQQAAKIPIIPMALNSGVFHPRNSWIKKSGRVIFEFLPPVAYEKSSKAKETLNKIEIKLEEKSRELMQEGKNNISLKSPKYKKKIAILMLLIIGGYTANWFITAKLVNDAAIDFLSEIKNNPAITEFKITEPIISGFPGKIKIFLDKQEIKTAEESLKVEFIIAESWPILGMPIDVNVGKIRALRSHWKKYLFLESIKAQIIFKNDLLTINDATAIADPTKGLSEPTSGQVSGYVDFNNSPYPKIDLGLTITNFGAFLSVLTSTNVIKPKTAMFAAITLRTLQIDNVVSSTITSDKNKIYLGPLRIFKYPRIKEASTLENGTSSSIATKRVRPDLDQ